MLSFIESKLEPLYILKFGYLGKFFGRILYVFGRNLSVLKPRIFLNHALEDVF